MRRAVRGVCGLSVPAGTTNAWQRCGPRGFEACPLTVCDAGRVGKPQAGCGPVSTGVPMSNREVLVSYWLIIGLASGVWSLLLFAWLAELYAEAREVSWRDF